MNENKSKSRKLAANSHVYKRKAFKICNKHHVDNYVLFLRFFCFLKYKYEQFFVFLWVKIKAGFKPQIFTFFVWKVITFPENEIEQYVVILKTMNFKICFMWLTLALIKKTPFCHILLATIFHQFKKKKKKRKKKNTGIVGNIQTDPWSEIYTSAAYINQGFKLSWNVLFNHYPFISKRRFGSYIPAVVFRYEKFTKS